MIRNIISMQTLAQYVSQVMRDKELSGNDVERRSNKGITQSHVHRIYNGEVKNVSTEKLKSLAKGLDVPEAELFAVARGASLQVGELVHGRLQSIDFAYDGMPKKKKERAGYLIELLEREIKRIESEPEE